MSWTFLKQKRRFEDRSLRRLCYSVVGRGLAARVAVPLCVSHTIRAIVITLAG